jgi:starvation-inducible DNA-binding protein
MARKDKKQSKKNGSKSSAAVVATLQRQQANALVAYLNYKKYHWLSYGPLFRDIHLMLDEQATLVYATIDEFAERAIMIGGTPLGDPADYLPNASVKPSKGSLSLDEMIAEARATLDVVIEEMHADAEVATEAGDIGTADLYTRLVQTHQKNRWFLNEILRKKDGLTS